MAQSSTRYVGMDVHQESSAVADVAQEPGAEGVSRGTIGTRQGDMEQRLRHLPAQGPPRVFVYAAGPGGDWRSRDLTHTGYVDGVIAPALIPQQPGDRVKTDRRDARPLARLRRSGDLSPG